MKQFLKNLLTSVLGVLVAFLLIFLIGMGLVSALGNKDKVKVKANSVLKLDFKESIPELTDNVEQEGFSLSDESTVGLKDFLDAIAKAKTDDKIKGIFIEAPQVMMGTAKADNIRKALADFKTSGKFVIAYANSYSQKAYYLASAADKVYMNPMGAIDMRGPAIEITFFKGMLDKLGIKMNIFYCGKFKSATEPYRMTEMSPENKTQLRQLLTGFLDNYVNSVSSSRSINQDSLRSIIDNFSAREAGACERLKLIDGIRYKDQVIDEMKEKLGLKDDEDIEAISIADYAKANRDKKDYSKKDRIAIVYAEGEIGDEGEENGAIQGERYAKLLRKLRKDKHVKAVVLRVNSPGGSALASDMIWREIERLKQKGVKVVVSMGDVAASGGYYISANADKIYAEANTITGSIGVFGMIPNVRQFTNNTLAVTVDTVRTGKFSAMNPLYYDMTPEEAAQVQQGVDSIYYTFKKRVADGRKLTMEQVEEIAQGRVWLGSKAKELGLVDELGGLDAAIKHAAELAGLGNEYRTSSYPEIQSGFEALMKKFGGKAQYKSLVKEEMGDLYPYYEAAKKVRQMKGVQAKMPFELIVK